MNNHHISVIGFGKIGQALTAQILRSGATVTAIDIDPAISRLFEAGDFRSSEPGVEQVLTTSYSNGLLKLSAMAADGADAFIIAVPLLVDELKQPLVLPFLDVIKSLVPLLRHNTLVVIETSVPVGFCRGQVLPLLSSTGKVHGQDFLLAHSPERIKSGSMLSQLASVPKIIGGIDGLALQAAMNLYGAFIHGGLIRAVENIEAAELVKMAGMMYRDLNIALANQLAVYAGSIHVDLEALRDLINADGEASLLSAGIGVGGHCTPVYPYFMIESFRQQGLSFTLAAEARKINEGMAAYAASLRGIDTSKVLVLGLAFRPGVKEDAFSPAYALVTALHDAGIETMVHDPLYLPEELSAKGLIAATDLYGSGADTIIVVTMHHEYGSLDFERLYRSGIRIIVDGRNGLNRKAVEAASIMYKGIGR